MNIEKYLNRIDIKAPPSVSKSFLFQLHENHLLNVPFENLDVHYQVPIRLDIRNFYEKIVEKGRGGFCYELNGLFRHLLKKIGFKTKIISCRVYEGEDRYTPDFDHMAIIVTIDAESYLVDVGFGDFILKPLPITYDCKIEDPNGTFVFNKHSQMDYIQLSRLRNGEPIPEYIFKTNSRNLSQFSKMCDFHQYSPESHMAKKKMISKATNEGRITLTESDFIITKKGLKSKKNSSNKDFEHLVKKYFRIDLEMPK